MPDGSQSDVGRSDQYPHVHRRIPATDERDEERAGDQAQRPVQIGGDQREDRRERDRLGGALGIG